MISKKLGVVGITVDAGFTKKYKIIGFVLQKYRFHTVQLYIYSHTN